MENPDYCYCPCHAPNSCVVHIIACCRKCRHCGRNVKFMTSHLAECEEAICDKNVEKVVDDLYNRNIKEVYNRNTNEINTLDEYQNFANEMSGYEFSNLEDTSISHELIFNLIGLCGESGEVAEKIKKAIRLSNINDFSTSLTDEKKTGLALELGDVLYYLSRIANMLDLKMSNIARLNQEKLLDRLSRDVVKGEGDYR